MLLVILGKFLRPEWLHMTSMCMCGRTSRLRVPTSSNETLVPILTNASNAFSSSHGCVVPHCGVSFPSRLKMLSIFYICSCHLYFLCDAVSAQIFYQFLMGWLYYWVLNSYCCILLLLNTLDTGPISDRCFADIFFPSMIWLFILLAILSESRF